MSWGTWTRSPTPESLGPLEPVAYLEVRVVEYKNMSKYKRQLRVHAVWWKHGGEKGEGPEWGGWGRPVVVVADQVPRGAWGPCTWQRPAAAAAVPQDRYRPASRLHHPRNHPPHHHRRPPPWTDHNNHDSYPSPTPPFPPSPPQ